MRRERQLLIWQYTASKRKPTLPLLPVQREWHQSWWRPRGELLFSPTWESSFVSSLLVCRMSAPCVTSITRWHAASDFCVSDHKHICVSQLFVFSCLASFFSPAEPPAWVGPPPEPSCEPPPRPSEGPAVSFQNRRMWCMDVSVRPPVGWPGTSVVWEMAAWQWSSWQGFSFFFRLRGNPVFNAGVHTAEGLDSAGGWITCMTIWVSMPTSEGHKIGFQCTYIVFTVCWFDLANECSV